MQAESDPWNSSAEPARGSRGPRGGRRGRGRGSFRGRGSRTAAPAQPAATQSTPQEEVKSREPRPRPKPQTSEDIVKTEPVFVETKDLEPEARGLNLRLVVVGEPRLIKHLRYGNGREEKEWSVEAGDPTGTVNVRVATQPVGEALRDGVSIIVRNAFVEMVDRKHMRLATDLFGKIELAPAFSFRPDVRTKHSDTEYERE